VLSVTAKANGAYVAAIVEAVYDGRSQGQRQTRPAGQTAIPATWSAKTPPGTRIEVRAKSEDGREGTAVLTT
jgi:hypothetical protein